MNDKDAQKPQRPPIPQRFRRHNFDPPPSVRPPPPPPPPAKWFVRSASNGNWRSTSPYAVAIAEALRIPDSIEKDGRLDGFALMSHEHVYRGALCAVAMVQARAMDRESAAGNIDRARHVARKYAQMPGIWGVRALCGIAVAAKNSGFNPESDFQIADKIAHNLLPPFQAATASDATQAVAEVYAYRGDIHSAREAIEEIGSDDAMIAHKDLAIAFSEAGYFSAALEETMRIPEVADIRHIHGVWDTIASGQAEAMKIAEAEQTVAKINDWIWKLKDRFHQGQKGAQCNDVIGAWSDRLESALKTAWILKQLDRDLDALDTFRDFIDGVGGIRSPLCRAKAWAAFARHLVHDPAEQNG